MKKLINVIGFIAAISATVLSTTQWSDMAITPIIIAFISGLIIIFLSKKQKVKTKTIQYIFLLVIISLSLTIYKNVMHSPEVNKTSEIELNDKDQIENPKEVQQNNQKD